MTQKEIESVNGNMMNALDSLRSKNTERKEIPSLAFQRIANDDDIPDDRDIHHEDTKDEKESHPRVTRRTQCGNNDRAESWKLSELENSLVFIQEFNSDLLKYSKQVS